MTKKPAHTLDLSRLLGPPLQRILQLVCETDSPKDACSLLRTCRWIRLAVQHSCAGLVPIKCSSNPQQLQALAVAAWLKQNPLLARSLSIELFGEWYDTTSSEDRQAAVSALAQALQTSTSVSVISSCCLLSVGPECVEILHQLPSRHLTSLQMSLWQPSNAAFTDDQLQEIATALSQMQQLESVELGFQQWAIENKDGLDCLLTAMSAMSKLTSLTLEGVSSNDELRRLPTHLKELEFFLHCHALEFEVQLDHLTQLTKLVALDLLSLRRGSTIPTSLQQLAIGECESCAALTQLSQLKDLSFTFYSEDNIGAETLAQFSTLRALTSVDLHFEGNALPSSLGKASFWERLPVRKLWVNPDCYDDMDRRSMPPAPVPHMTCLTQLTQLHLSSVDFSETTCEQFAVVLGQLTTLQRLDLMNLRYRPSNSIQLANTGGGVSHSTHRDVATGLGTATGQREHADAVDPDMTAAIVATVDFEHVADAIASLPDLCYLSLEQQPITPKAAQHLGACCGNIKELCLKDCSMTDVTLGCILVGLSDVVVLDVSGNKHLTDQVLLLIRDHLQYVGKYVFAGTQITQAGVQCYLSGCDACVDKKVVLCVQTFCLPSVRLGQHMHLAGLRGMHTLSGFFLGFPLYQY